MRFLLCVTTVPSAESNGNGVVTTALADDNALTSKSQEDSPVPIEAVPLESSVPDDAVPGLPPLV